MSNYPKGSEWRKWDLHVHTPKSINQEYGGDTVEAWDAFILDLESLPSSFKVIGINDYNFIDGYKKVLEYRQKGRLHNIDLILPVIEFRINKFASLGDEAWKKVNLHIIFSNEITPEEIEAQFLNALQHSLKLSPDIEGITFEGIATRAALTEVGRKIKLTSPAPTNDSDLKVGFANIVFDYDAVIKLTKGYFKGNCLTAIGKSEWDVMRWTGSPAEKKSVINKADFSFISLEKYEDYDKHTKALDTQKVKSVLLDCSDAHALSSSKNKDRIGNCFTWLKADPTFEGLKQVANDRERIFIGEIPPLLLRVENNKRKFIRTLTMEKINPAFTEKWFEGFELPMNHSMVAIIGNKGNGKSALADALGLVGNTPNYEYFSFLNSKKFRNKKPLNKSEAFEACIKWEDGLADSTTLDKDPRSSSIEKIKYIPQGFLERLCNKNTDDLDIFEPELRKVIFSHIPEPDRLGLNTLNELIDFKTEITNNEIGELKKEIASTNRLIVELEKKKTPDYYSFLQQQLAEKLSEATALDSVKPDPINPPSDPTIIKQNEGVSKDISEKRSELKNVETTINERQAELAILQLEVTEVDKVIQNVTALENQFAKLAKDLVPTLTKYAINLNEIATLKIDKDKLQSLIFSRNGRISEIQIELLDTDNRGLFEKKQVLLSSIANLQERLDNQSKLYQKYLDEEKAWQEKKASIIGTPTKNGTVEYFLAQLKYLDEQLQLDLSEQYEKRIQAVKMLYRKKGEVLTLYKSLFKPVSDFISTYGKTLEEDYAIRLDVDYKVDGFVEKFFDHISMGAKGSFIGNPNGIERLKQILEVHDLKNEEGLIAFLNDVIDNVQYDYREPETKPVRDIEKQLKKGYSIFDFYSFLLDMDYLMPEFKLKLGEKTVSELSPGERGALLLIFYLTLDQDTIPLVIDQPEENLDNQSIFKILVQFIKHAKNRRQIIIVTHNPNLAVASNAEQIVYVSIEKKDGNAVKYITGALENPEINTAVIDILEGTYPALTARTNTYKIIKR
jgi:ABC-type lipoprotein export system ATPase subunit